MANQTEYGVIKQSKLQHPVSELLVVPHKGGALTVSFPAFGPNTYRGNLEAIGKTYSHPQTGEVIGFRPATTSESISAAHYDFEKLAKPEIFDSRWFQAGYIVRTQDGVFTNTTETDRTQLMALLDKAEKVDGIYLLGNGVGFAPYESFERGKQDVDTFTQGGLARALEHTHEKTATKLRDIGSPKLHKRGVNVWGFATPKEPIVRVASLYSDVDGLNVDCDDWDGGDDGFAFGVSK